MSKNKNAVIEYFRNEDKQTEKQKSQTPPPKIPKSQSAKGKK